MKPFSLLILVPAAFLQSATAPAQSANSCAAAGRYSVTGQIPGATGYYRGEATISSNGTGCYMRWFPPNDSEGTGTYVNGVLTIAFTFANGGQGMVSYNRAPNGEFRGRWWMNANPSSQGTETLRPL